MELNTDFRAARLIAAAVLSNFRVIRANAGEPEQNLWSETLARVPHRHTPTVEEPVTSKANPSGSDGLVDRQRWQPLQEEEDVSKIKADSERLFGR